MNYLLKIENVTKKISGNTVLEDINLELYNQKVYGFYGANGSGKSMLFRVMSGLVKPTVGHVWVKGRKLDGNYSFPESIGVLIESPGFWPNYTGAENLKILASIKNKINEEDIRNSLQRVGLEYNDTRNYKKYSLGMKQRLAIAQAIMEKPEIIILDEPTNALDENGVELIRNIILEEKDRGATILLASHNKEDINILADEVFKISKGKLESSHEK
ncbi:ATP-binding cassette domain-containing protein [Paenibacillus bovis]|uniref:Multidrug ABC transporter ATP-binding protein n=1 Tax=Paenibacillus bovis TaxID=1616788 RepID=A0A172ZBU9_9BACL|nr:ATP-binding cassette domain-containing protein [Paenibacillus bovis]ANF94999.1 multidrug ABC transporter ATP-binding protein [Paenibacillus bovis]